MNITTAKNGDHRVLRNEHGNVMQIGRKAAERVIRALRREGHHAYPMRFAPTIYFIGIAETAAEADTLQALYDAERDAVQRMLARWADSADPALMLV